MIMIAESGCFKFMLIINIFYLERKALLINTNDIMFYKFEMSVGRQKIVSVALTEIIYYILSYKLILFPLICNR